MKTIKQLFNSHEFRRHFIAAAVLVSVVLYLLFSSLGWYTNHGETVTVPDLRKMTLEQADEVLTSKDFEYEIDSVYSLEQSGGTVIEQDPEANAKVKEGRRIYLTIVSVIPPSTKLPNLKDVSLREATAILESYGIKVGKLIYKPDLAQNAVLDIQKNGRSIKVGALLEKGTVVDLVLGDGYGNTSVQLPNLIGLTLEEALFVLQGSSLNMGIVQYDETVKDQGKAVVYKQTPTFYSDSSKTLNQGYVIDLYLTQDKFKINNPSSPLKLQ